MPVNVCGRTGIIGRGLLGRYGPNHAGDPIVTRWKRNADGSIHQHNETAKYINAQTGTCLTLEIKWHDKWIIYYFRNILQMLAIQRRDSGEWAIPGGMVDPGETVTNTLKREFIEEALNSQKGIAYKIEEFNKIIRH